MSINRIKLSQIPKNHSFSHQTSLSQALDTKHKKKQLQHKKQSLYKKQKTPTYKRLKTHQKECSIMYKNQHINSYNASIPFNNSSSKLIKQKHINIINDKKNKKKQHTISVINLTRSTDNSNVKHKGSSKPTKRKVSTVEFNQKIKQKMQDYKILSNCLQQYVKQQRRNNKQVNIVQIIKIISAFNRSQINPMNKHLSKLITQIINSINNSLPTGQSHKELKSILKKSTYTYDSPSKDIQQQQKNSDTVKKRIINKQQQTKDVLKLQQNLDKLKYQSNRLKHFLQQISTKPKNKIIFDNIQVKNKIDNDKIQQLRRLRQIASQQAKIIRQLQYSQQQSDTFRQQSY